MTNTKWSGRVPQVVKLLSNNWEALSSTSQYHQEKKKKKGREGKAEGEEGKKFISLILPCKDTSRKLPSILQGRETSSGTEWAGTLILDFPAWRAVRNKISIVWVTQTWYLYWNTKIPIQIPEMVFVMETQTK
jgi:hypothetical protein